MYPLDPFLKVFVPDKYSKSRQVAFWSLEELFHSRDDVAYRSQGLQFEIMNMHLERVKFKTTIDLENKSVQRTFQ